MGRSSVPPLAFTWRKIRPSITLSVILLLEAVSNAALVRMGANVQNQSVHALCGQGRHPGSCAVPGGTRRGTRIDCRRSRRRRDQAADRASWPREVGGFRTLIVFRAGTRAIFVHGFAKNEKDNIEREDLAALKRLAAEMSAYHGKTIARVVASGVLVEVTCDEKTIP